MQNNDFFKDLIEQPAHVDPGTIQFDTPLPQHKTLYKKRKIPTIIVTSLLVGFLILSNLFSFGLGVYTTNPHLYESFSQKLKTLDLNQLLSQLRLKRKDYITCKLCINKNELPLQLTEIKPLEPTPTPEIITNEPLPTEPPTPTVTPTMDQPSLIIDTN